MSVDAIRVVLGRLQDDTTNETAWDELAEIVTAPGVSDDHEHLRVLEQARARFERRREWRAVARLLDLELSLAKSPEPAMQAEYARILDEELFDSDGARAAYGRLLELRPSAELARKAETFLEDDDAKRVKWQELYERYLSEAAATNDESLIANFSITASDVLLRYGILLKHRGNFNDAPAEDRAKAAELVEKAIGLEPKVKRGASHADVALQKEPARLAACLTAILERGGNKDERAACGIKAAKLLSGPLGDRKAATRAFEQVLDLSPGQPDALSFLAEAYTESEDWDHLVALYEDQLKGGIRGEAEQGVLLQIAMVQWRMREAPELAEPYFDRLRKSDPQNGAMLNFFRERAKGGDSSKLAQVLTDAQRTTTDTQLKKELASEIAKLAESSDNAQKAIEQYKAVLKADPADEGARDALRRLYGQTSAFPALVDLLKHDLERKAADDRTGRSAILREIAGVHRDKLRNEQQLVQTLVQLTALDESDIDSLRELVGIYDHLGRFRDLLTCQQKLAELTSDEAEKADLYRSIARRWADQFSNVQNAITGYESLLAVLPKDDEARTKLKDLYTKRRAWAQLYTLLELDCAEAEGKDKIEILSEMAKLASERLDRGADAIALQKQILDLDSQATTVYDALEKQAEREKDYATLAEVLERRVAASEDVPTKLGVLQKLGAVYADRLKDSAATTQTWLRVLELAPGQAKALRVLRDTYVASGDFDALSKLYESQDDWEGLADFLSTSAEKAHTNDQKIDLSFRAAEVFEEKLSAKDRATKSYERVLSVDPSNLRAANALVPSYERDHRFAKLPALYEVLLTHATAAEERVAHLLKLSALTGEHLGDREGAITYARQAYELDPSASTLDVLEGASRAASSWTPFVEAIEKRLGAKPAPSAPEERMLRSKLANAYARELGKLDEAVVSYRALIESDPTDQETMTEFDALLRGAERQEDLRWLFDLRVRTAPDNMKAATYDEWATLEEDVFGNPTEAINLYRKASALAPHRRETLKSLSRLLLQNGNHQEAASVISRHRDLSEGADRAEREIELAFLYIDHLKSPEEALLAAERAIDLRPRDSDAINILARLVDVPETRARASRILERAYGDLNDVRRQVQMIRIMLETATEPDERRALHRSLADLEENNLSSPSAALDTVLRALGEFPNDIELWDAAEQLSGKSGRPTDLADAFRMRVLLAEANGTQLDAEVMSVLCGRAAALHDEQLGDPDGALPYLRRILSMDPKNEPAFERQKQILTTGERWGELEELFDSAAKTADVPAQRIALLNEVALIAEEVIGIPEKAIHYHERILEIDPLHVASLDALEKLYEEEERYTDLTNLLERRLETAIGEEAVEIRFVLGGLYLDQLHQPEAAFAHVKAILVEHPDDSEATELAERMLGIGSLRLRTASLLEGVYEARDDIKRLVQMLEIRLDDSKDAAETVALLRRIGELRDERLGEESEAFDAYARLVPVVPEDESVRSRFVEIGRRLSQHDKLAGVLEKAADGAEGKGVRAELSMMVAGIYEGALGDSSRAEDVYRKVLKIDPEDVEIVIPAARALSRLQAESGRHADLAESLQIEVHLEESVEARKAIYERLGDLYETMLEKRGMAINAWRSRLADDDADEHALTALERLYDRERADETVDEDRRRAASESLVEILRKREQVSTDDSERRRALVKAAGLLSGAVGNLPEATLVWRSILETFGADREAHAALIDLYGKAERYNDLAETFEADLTLAEEPAERIALLRRLGDTRSRHLSNLDGALEAYRSALEIDPNDLPTRKALEALLDVPEARRPVAEILHPLYEADGDAERLLRVLAIEAEVSDTSAEKIDRLEKSLATAEGPLGDAKRAYGYAKLLMVEATQDDSAAKQMATLERLTEVNSAWQETCSLYRKIVKDVLDGEVQFQMLRRVGELSRDKLGAPADAIEFYRQALEARPDDADSLLALEKLYAESGDSSSLLSILKKREELSEDGEERKALMFRQSELLRDPLKRPSDAIAVLEAILDIDVDPKATSQLEELYQGEARHRDRVTLYERTLDAIATGDTRHGAAADLRVRLAGVARRELSDAPRAFDELALALSEDEASVGAVAELESMMADGGADGDQESRARAAEMLEPVYLRRGDWKEVEKTLEARLLASENPSDRADLLRRLATLQEEQLENFRGAMDANARLLAIDYSDRSVWSELERLAKVAEQEKVLADIYASELSKIDSDDETTAELSKRVGEIYADAKLVAPALTWYQRAHRFEPENEELFRAIERLLIQEDRHEDRATLLRTVAEHRDGDAKLAILHTLGDLLKNKLSRPSEAVDTYREALDLDTRNAETLDRLTELYRESNRQRDLADLYQLRIDGAETAESAAPYRLSLSRVLATDLGDSTGAIDQLEAIVSEVPWFSEAVGDLENFTRDEKHKARVVDILRPIYERSDDWRLLVKLNRDRLELASDKSERAAILRENAQLMESRGGQKAEAFEALREAFKTDPEDVDIRAEVQRLAGDLQAYEPLAESLEGAASVLEDEVHQREVLSILAAVYNERLNDPRRALLTYERLADKSPGEIEPLNTVDDLAVLLGDWPKVVSTIEKKVEGASDTDGARLLRRLGQTLGEMCDDEPGAIKAYERALDLEPDNVLTVDFLTELYERTTNPSRLVELYARRVELSKVSPDAAEEAELRYDLNLKAAAIYEGALANASEAIASLGAALEAKPGDGVALKALERLYRKEGLTSELLENLQEQASLATDITARAGLRLAIGDLNKDKLDNSADALEQYRLVLDEVPDHQGAIDALRAIATSSEDLRLEATDILLPVLRQRQAHVARTEVLETRLLSLTDAEARAACLREIAETLDVHQDKKKEAHAALLRAVTEVPVDTALHAEITRLSNVTDGFASYAEVLEQVAGDALQSSVARFLYVRLGDIAENQLKDDARAAKSLNSALEHSTDESDEAILASLDRLEERLGHHKALLDILERRLPFADDAEQANLHLRSAKLHIGPFSDPRSGLGSLRAALERAPAHVEARAELEKLTDVPSLFVEVSEMLEGVYRQSGDTQALARLYEKRIAHADGPSDRLRLRLELARVLEERGNDASAAQEALLVGLDEDPSDSELLTEIERVTAITSAWDKTAKALEAALGRDRELPTDTRSDLWVRAATWRHDRLSDHPGALSNYQRALLVDPENEGILRAIEQLQRTPGSERDLIETLRRLARLDGMTGSAELRREAKAIAQSQLDDAPLTEAILREMIAADEADVWALTELTEARRKAGDHKETFNLLVRRTELAEKAEDLKALRHEAAAVASGELADAAAATDIYQQIFEEDPTDERASNALRKLYGEGGKKKELLLLLGRLIDVADVVSVRSALRLEAANVSTEQDAVGDAIDYLNAVLDEEPSERNAALMLSRLYEQSGRDDDLASLLEKQIQIALDRGDLEGELSYRVRLGEVQENRLGDLDKAQETFRSVLDRDSSHVGALVALSRILEKRGDKKEASIHLERLLEISKGQEAVATAKRLFALFETLGDEDGAERALEKGLTVDPEDADIRAKLKAVYEKRKAHAKLADLLVGDSERAVETSDKVRLLRTAAEIKRSKLSDAAGAADLLGAASQLVPQDRELLLSLCDAYSESGRGKDAVLVLQKIVDSYGGRRSKEVAGIHHRLARAHLADGDRTTALAELDTAFKIDPGSIVVLRDLGVLSLELAEVSSDQKEAYVDRAGKAFKALLLQRLEDGAPITKAEVFYYLGVVAHLQSDDKRAIQMLERSIDNDKTFEKARELMAQLKK